MQIKYSLESCHYTKDTHYALPRALSFFLLPKDYFSRLHTFRLLWSFPFKKKKREARKTSKSNQMEAATILSHWHATLPPLCSAGWRMQVAGCCGYAIKCSILLSVLPNRRVRVRVLQLEPSSLPHVAYVQQYSCQPLGNSLLLLPLFQQLFHRHCEKIQNLNYMGF